MNALRPLNAALLILLAFAASAAAVDTSELLIRLAPGTESTALADLEAAWGVTSSSVSAFSGIHRLTLSAGVDASAAAQAFSASAYVSYAELNGVMTTAFTPNDPFYTDSRDFQWNFKHIGMPEAWDINPGGSSSTVIAVIDTGAAYEDYMNYRLAPDLAGTTFVQGYDFVNDDTHPNDDDGHGTHVTGTIAQTTHNAYGVAGIAYNCAIMPLKALDATGSGTYADVADAIYYAVDHGANVINMSLGGPTASSLMTDAVAYAYAYGVTVVAASGNDNETGVNAINYPARYSTVIAVGATRYDNAVTWYSNKGPQLDVVAPGGDTAIDQNGDGYGDGILQNDFNPITLNYNSFSFWFFQGTSMATPHVTAVVALMYDLGLTDPDLIRSVVQSTATDLGAAGFDETYGYGLINAAAALALADAYPYPGDANADGYVDGADLALWQENYDPLGLNADNNTFAMGDWSGDGLINGADLALWQGNYAPLGYLGQMPSGGGALMDGAGAFDASAAPEPATWAILAAGCVAGMLRRRRLK